MNFQQRLPIVLIIVSLLSGCMTLTSKPVTEEAKPIAASNPELKMTESLSGTAEDWFQKGNEYLEQKQSLMAIESYHRALQLDKSHTKAWHNLGLIYLQRATIAFENLVKQAKEDDMLKQRAEYVVNAMQEILTEGFKEQP